MLYPLAFTGLTSDEAAYRKALEGELLRVMSRLLEKRGGRVIDTRPEFKRGLDAHPIKVEMRDEESMAVDLKIWNDFSTLFYPALGLHLETVVIDDALTSTIFLDYDPVNGAYVQNIAFESLSNLWGEIRHFNELATNENLSLLFETSPRALGRKVGRADLPVRKVATLYSLAHRWINILDLCQALISYLSGQPFRPPELMPFSPVIGLEERIRAERVSVAELRTALGIS